MPENTSSTLRASMRPVTAVTDTLEEPFNTRVRAFLESTGLRPAALGMRALDAPPIPVRRMQAARAPWRRPANRVLAFMAAFDGDSGGARTPPRRPRQRKPSTRAGRATRSRAMTAKHDQTRRPPTRFLRISEVQARTSLSRSTIRRWAKCRRFPSPIVLGEGVVVWIESEVEEWSRNRIADTRGGGQPAVP